ncbi:MAG: hypothetical protein AVDCRST_MAG64-758, partial [uncultured Phycisphaerae bacterium]
PPPDARRSGRPELQRHPRPPAAPLPPRPLRAPARPLRAGARRRRPPARRAAPARPIARADPRLVRGDAFPPTWRGRPARDL